MLRLSGYYFGFLFRYGGTVRLCWNDNYSTTHTYRYLLMSKVVQSEE